MIKIALMLIVLWLSVTAAGNCQQTTTLFFDTSNMKVTVSLDRQTYLPGEVAQVTLEVSNPASVGVKSLTPFVSAAGCLVFRWREGGLLHQEQSPDCVSIPVDESNTTQFGPGETKRLVLNSYDPIFDIGPMVMDGGAVPEHPRGYGITYWYGSTKATAEYTVAAAQLEAEVTARVHDLMLADHPDLPPHNVPAYVHVLALRSDGTSYICVQQDVAGPNLVTRSENIGKNLDVTDPRVSMIRALRYKRVATSTAPIVSLSAAADSQENLTIEWKDSTGRQDKLYYPASYPVRSSSHNQ